MPAPDLLLCPSPPRWLALALSDLDTLLLDLAHCEKKAASTVLSFLFRAPEHDLAGVLSRLAREELTHFEWCLRALEARGRTFTRQEPSTYAAKLTAPLRRKGREALLDAFLAAALIEARSGERLVLLRDHVGDADLQRLFAALHPPEERHVEILYGLAARFGEPAPRLAELAALEADIIGEGEPWVRMHA